MKDVVSHFIDVSCTVAMCFTCGLVHGYLVAPLSVKRFAKSETTHSVIGARCGTDWLSAHHCDELSEWVLLRSPFLS